MVPGCPPLLSAATTGARSRTKPAAAHVHPAMPNAAASRIVLEPYSEERVTETARALLAEVGGKVSCAFVFASADYRESLPDFLELLQVHGHVPVIAGCSGAGL